MSELELLTLPDGRVIIPSNGDPAALHYPTGWDRSFTGLDLGRNDPSALVVVRDTCYPVRTARGRVELGPRDRTVVYADRIRDTDYMDLAAYVAQFLAQPAMRNTTLIMDSSGLGEPFSSVLTQSGIDHYACTITGGATINRNGFKLTCSKNVLLELLASGFETSSLSIAADLALRDALIQEIAAFELAVTAAGGLVLQGGGKGHHSDMAIACALAYLASEKLVGQAITTVKLRNYYC